MNVTIFSYHIRRAVAVFVVSLLLGLATHFVQAQQANPPKPASAQPPDKSEINRIISQFTAGETELLEEFNRYGYQRDFEIQSLKGSTVIGKLHRISEISGTLNGQPREKILSYPMPTGNIVLTLEDLENLGGPYLFPLRSANANLYKFAYVAKEQIGNSDCYVFDAKPISLLAQRRLFRGRVWVEVGSLRIVKTLGKFEQKGDQRFPVLETNRAAIDGRFQFPATVSGDDELVFPNGQSLHLRINVSYTEYVKTP